MDMLFIVFELNDGHCTAQIRWHKTSPSCCEGAHELAQAGAARQFRVDGV